MTGQEKYKKFQQLLYLKQERDRYLEVVLTSLLILDYPLKGFLYMTRLYIIDRNIY